MRKEKSKILYLDDDILSLKVFHTSFSEEYQIFLAENELEATKIFKEHEIEVFVVDQYMPDIDGTDLIIKIKKEYPEVICIMLTGQASKSLLLTAINEVEVFWFLEKPLDKFDGKQAIDRAIDSYWNKKEKNRLSSELKSAVDKIYEIEQIKTDLLMNLSHELRTPLNGIMGFSQLLADDLIENQKFQQYFKILNESSNNLVKVIDDIITASKVQSDDVKQTASVFTIKSLFQNLYNHFKQDALRKNIEVKIIFNDKLDKLQVKTDRGILYEIFTQLLKNAFKFTSKGVIEFGVFDYNKQIFFVKDSGVGIEKNEKEAIFEYFRQGKQKKYTRQFGGLGLGLSIAKGLLDIVGGSIWFESEKNRNTIFYFTFPFVESKLDNTGMSFELSELN